MHFGRQNLHNKVWKRDSRIHQPAESRPKTGQNSGEGQSEKYSQAKVSNHSSAYYLARPPKVRTRSISDQHRQAADLGVTEQKNYSPDESSPEEPLNIVGPGVSQFEAVSPERNSVQGRDEPNPRRGSIPDESRKMVARTPVKVIASSTGANKKDNQSPVHVVETGNDRGPKTSESNKPVIQVSRYSKMPQIPKKDTQQNQQISDNPKPELPKEIDQTQTISQKPVIGALKQNESQNLPESKTKQAAQMIPHDKSNHQNQKPTKKAELQQELQSKVIENREEPPSPMFGAKGVNSKPTKTSDKAQVADLEEKPQHKLPPEKEITHPDANPLIQLEAVNPDPDYVSQAHSHENSDMASYMQEMDSDAESLRGDDKRESPLKSPNKISKFHPSNSPQQKPRRASEKTPEGIYVQDSVVEGQQRAFDHYSPESPPSTPESPPQILAARQLARPVRLGLNPRTTVALKDRPKLLLRYVFKKVVRMVAEVAKLIEIQQQTLGPSASLTFKGPEGMLSPQPVKSPDGQQAGAESRKFDFSKSPTHALQNLNNGAASKPNNKGEFDIYQPREFNVSPSPAFSHRSNNSKEGGFLLAVQQVSKQAFKLGAGDQTYASKEIPASMNQPQIYRSRDSGHNLNQDPAPLVLNKSVSQGRSMTNSSAMKELSYEEFAESYFGDIEDKNSATLMSQRRPFEKFYIGYFDFKQKVAYQLFRLSVNIC